MKGAFLSLAIILALGMPALHSQDADPAPAAAPTAPEPIPPVEKGTPLAMLKAMRDANAKLLEQQAATLQKIDEMEKTAQTLKVLGKRS